MNNLFKKHLLLITVISFAIGIALAGLLPFLLTRSSLHENLDFSKTGQIGDTIGGIANPVIAATAAIITFFAFWVQYQANQSQRKQLREQANQFKDQETIARKDKFESRFYEMLRIHRQNAEGISFDKLQGQDVFPYLYDELRVAFHFALLRAGSFKELQNISIPDSHIYNLAYSVFFLGIRGENLFYGGDEIFEGHNKLYVDDYLKDITNVISQDRIRIGSTKELPAIDIPRPYRYYLGHASHLGHYLRHLYFTARLIDTSMELSETEKYHFARILRAQLSMHEQILLYYNACSVFGKSWVDEDLLVKYKLVKNAIPSLLYFGPKIFGIIDNPDYFEWDEVKVRVRAAPSA